MTTAVAANHPIPNGEWRGRLAETSTYSDWNVTMQTIGLSMSYVDPEDADTQSLTMLGILSDDGTSADWSGVGNTASGPADGSTVNTTLQLSAARSGTALTGRTYSITLQCAEGGTPPAGQNQVTVQVTVPHDQGQ